MRKARARLALLILPFLISVSGFADEIPYTSSDSFPLPVELENAVSFWIAVYTKYHTNEHVLHDARDLTIIYEIVEMGELNEAQIDLPKTRQQRNFLKSKSKYYRSILLKLASSKTDLTKLTPEEARVFKLFGESKDRNLYRQAAYNVRSQRGQKERFRMGLALSGRYLSSIKRIFREYGLPEELTVLPHVESSFNYRAYSSAGAAGIWQITRRTGRSFLKINYEIDERRDPILATEAAAKILKSNFKELESWPLAITAYNHGLAGMRRAKRKLNTTNMAKIAAQYRSRYFGFASRNFYCEFLAALHIVRNHHDYFGEINFENPLVYQEFELPYYVKFSSIASHFKLSMDELREYNPALRNPIFQGTKYLPQSYRLRIPKQVQADVQFASIPKSELFVDQKRSQWYQVRRGDTLSLIARRHRTSIAALMEFNNIASAHKIWAGEVLRIPSKGQLTSLDTMPNVSSPQMANQRGKQTQIASASPPEKPVALGAPEPETILPRVDRSSIENRTPFEPDILHIADSNPREGIIVVQPEETLGHFADWLRVPTQRIRMWNDFEYGEDLLQGGRIRLVFERVSAEKFNNSRLEYHRGMEEDFFANFAVFGTNSHRVKSGENIWYLCNQVYNLPMWLIRSYNSDLDFDRLQIGDLITIPEVLARDDKQIPKEQTPHSSMNDPTGSN